MRIGGLQRTSMVDFPGKLAAVVFTQGCPFRCGYCHNPSLVLPKLFEKPIKSETIWSFLQQRQGQLDAVVVSGGEPTLQPDLVPFLRRVRKLGYLIKLDTMGLYPQVIRDILSQGLVDYLAMDIKAPWGRYQEVVGRAAIISSLQESVSLLLENRVDYEFRTTVVDGQLTTADLQKMGRQIAGAKRYALQMFRPLTTLSPDFVARQSLSQDLLHKVATQLESMVGEVVVRAA